MLQKEKLAEGKTKIIWSTLNKNIVLIESKDDITAGDGVKHDIIKQKGALATETTCNCFSLLETKGIPTHFLKRKGEREFLARRVKMIPIELVARRIATGSYLKRNPEVVEGTIFQELVFEPFYKKDELRDPLMIWNEDKDCFELFDAKKPVAEGYLKDLPPEDIRILPDYFLKEDQLYELADITCSTFLALETPWKKLGVTLVDLKIECGLTVIGQIVVADVIDNDSWRIWPGGKKEEMKDKQVYRELKDTTTEALMTIGENYRWVAMQTREFIR